MMADPTPLRFRTYLWFPVLTVGAVLGLTTLAATGVDSGALGLLLFLSLAGLYVAGLFLTLAWTPVFDRLYGCSFMYSRRLAPDSRGSPPVRRANGRFDRPWD